MSAGYLAFDRERLALLGRSLTAALDESREWPLDDDAAREARDSVARAVDAVGDWPGRLRSIAACGALTDLFSWGPNGSPGGLTMTRDRLPARTATDLALLAQGLADWLAGNEVDLVEVETLLSELTGLRGSPGAVAAFLEALGATGVQALLGELATRARREPNAVNAAGPDVAPLLELLDLLGPGFARVLAANPSTWEPVLVRADPFVVARVLASALQERVDAPATSATPSAFASSLVDVFSRLASPDPLDLLWRAGGTTLLRALVADADLARRVMIDLPATALEFVLVRLDPSAAGQLLLTVADPGHSTADEARAPVLATLAALASYKRGNDDPQFGGSPAATAGEPFPREAWFPDFNGVQHPVPVELAPDRLGEFLAPWLPFLVAPRNLTSWTPDTVHPWDLDGHDDALTQTLVLAMSDETDALVLRSAARAYLAGSLLGSTGAAEHGAFLVAGIEDALRSAGHDAVETNAAEVAANTDLWTFPLNFAPMWFALPAGEAASRVAESKTPDLRSKIAESELVGVEVAVAIGLGAVSAWRATHAPGSAPLPPVAPPAERDDQTPTDAGDSAIAPANDAARLVRDWVAAQDLTEDQRAEVTALYDAVYNAAAAGTTLVAG